MKCLIIIAALLGLTACSADAPSQHVRDGIQGRPVGFNFATMKPFYVCGAWSC